MSLGSPCGAPVSDHATSVSTPVRERPVIRKFSVVRIANHGGIFFSSTVLSWPRPRAGLLICEAMKMAPLAGRWILAVLLQDGRDIFSKRHRRRVGRSSRRASEQEPV